MGHEGTFAHLDQTLLQSLSKKQEAQQVPSLSAAAASGVAQCKLRLMLSEGKIKIPSCIRSSCVDGGRRDVDGSTYSICNMRKR